MNKITKHPAFQAFILVVGFTALLVFISFSCERTIERHEKETGKSLIEQIGADLKEIEKEFKKGYNSDTTKNE